MTPLNPKVFDQLRWDGVDSNELPEPEVFRKMFHDMAMLKPLSSADM